VTHFVWASRVCIGTPLTVPLSFQQPDDHTIDLFADLKRAPRSLSLSSGRARKPRDSRLALALAFVFPPVVVRMSLGQRTCGYVLFRTAIAGKSKAAANKRSAVLQFPPAQRCAVPSSSRSSSSTKVSKREWLSGHAGKSRRFLFIFESSPSLASRLIPESL